MTEQQIIKTLATEVMRWKADGIAYVKADNPEYMVGVQVAEWNPLQNIADAWQLVDKIGPFVYRKSPVENGDYYHVAKVFYQGYWYSEEGATVQDAICRTVLKAYGLLAR
ncbi:BC1872 family protein [Brevibacillus laterosporus]|uniref:BC1872 family protein n=1 Tax=Brevibacillus laterosporus TaxID=1465 RepID=UPI003D22C9AF